MQPDVLFWFYKDFDVCADRLRTLRRLNPKVRVFGLYGGASGQVRAAKESLDGFLDDFYAFEEEQDARWKWRTGDLMIARWHRDRGCRLEWETLFVFQWDMVVLASLEELFPTLKPGEILLSGYRPLTEVESWWGWVQEYNARSYEDFRAFRVFLAEQLGYCGELFACQFIVACLPRRFMDKYVEIGPPEVGFLEYKFPTLAKVFGVPVCVDHPYRPWWALEPATRQASASDRILNAAGDPVQFSTILDELSRPNGRRIFHPVYKKVSAWILAARHARWLAAWLAPLFHGAEWIFHRAEWMRRGLRAVKKLGPIRGGRI